MSEDTLYVYKTGQHALLTGSVSKSGSTREIHDANIKVGVVVGSRPKVVVSVEDGDEIVLNAAMARQLAKLLLEAVDTLSVAEVHDI